MLHSAWVEKQEKAIFELRQRDAKKPRHLSGTGVAWLTLVAKASFGRLRDGVPNATTF